MMTFSLVNKAKKEVIDMLDKTIPERKDETMSVADELIAEGEAKALVRLVQSTDMTLEKAANILKASTEAIEQARQQLK